MGADGALNAYVPAVQHNTSGPAWAAGPATAATPPEPGSSLPFAPFLSPAGARPYLLYNPALALGKDLLLTPGVYDLDSPIVVSRPGAVVLSLGYATLVPTRGNPDLVVLPNDGVKLTGGILFDAGAVNSPFLLSAGNPIAGAIPSDPDLFSDVFFRVGGAESPAHATVSFLDSAPNSIIDDMWVWRADHGYHGHQHGMDREYGRYGPDVSANDVTAYGLAVEHYQKNEVIWSGQGGKRISSRTSSLRRAEPGRMDGNPDTGRLPGLPGNPPRHDVHQLRHGQLRHVPPVERPALQPGAFPGHRPRPAFT